jgi:phenylacetate-coenzyme A ligase PaaK-like adenylate-forming protein
MEYSSFNPVFNYYALRVFFYQYENNPVYRDFVNCLYRHDYAKILNVNHYTRIPFLPIEFFKTHNIACFNIHPQTKYFESSGTTKQNVSKHYIKDEEIYQTSVLKAFEKFYGDPRQYLFIFLLPDEKERPHSSLIHMAQYLLSFSKYKESGFYLNKLHQAIEIIDKYKDKDIPLFILGISYALMDFADICPSLNESVIVMETGGMKGKREELPKKIFHNYLKNKLGISNIHSEYGMTELFSQAYSKESGIFQSPPWMKVLVREMEDPLCIYEKDKQGLLNIIDLANIHTCSFIATSDLGRLHENNQFEILGRSDFSDIRGCNLMYQ